MISISLYAGFSYNFKNNEDNARTFLSDTPCFACNRTAVKVIMKLHVNSTSVIVHSVRHISKFVPFNFLCFVHEKYALPALFMMLAHFRLKQGKSDENSLQHLYYCKSYEWKSQPSFEKNTLYF